MSNINKILKKIIFVILIIVIFGVAICFLYFYLWFKIGIINLEKQHNKNVEIELQNRDDNLKIFNEYIKDTYGIISETFEIDVNPAVVSTNTIFSIKTPFMENGFAVLVESETKKVGQDSFYKVLVKDPKFNHLYSNWVKKQIEIDDPNVELIMIFNNSIDFLNIKNKDNILEELFNNIVEYKVTNAYVKNVEINNEDDLTNYANNIHDIYFTFKKYNEESSGEFNLNDSVILIKEDINFLDKNVRKLGRYLDFPWNIDEKIIEFKDGKIVKIYQH